MFFVWKIVAATTASINHNTLELCEQKKGYGRQSLARLFELLRTGQQPEVGLGGLEPQEWGNKMPIKIGQFQKTRIRWSLRQVILRDTQIIPNTEIGEEFDMHLDDWVGSDSKLHKSLCFRKELHFLPARLPSLFYNSARGSPRVAAGNVGISSQWWWQYQLWMPRFGFNFRGWDDFKKYALKADASEDLLFDGSCMLWCIFYNGESLCFEPC